MKHLLKTYTLTDVPSPPARGRGLKRELILANNLKYLVAPRTGAWIETSARAGRSGRLRVAPRTGAWIETEGERAIYQQQAGRPPHGGVD